MKAKPKAKVEQCISIILKIQKAKQRLESRYFIENDAVLAFLLNTRN